MKINKHVTYVSPYFYRNFYGREFKAESEADLQREITEYGKRLALAKKIRPRLVKLDSIKGVHIDLFLDPTTNISYVEHNGVLKKSKVPQGRFFTPDLKHKVHVQLQLVQNHTTALAKSQNTLRDLLL